MSESIDEYIETIYHLTEKERTAKTTAISNELNVKPASVTEMMQKLSRMGLIEYEPYKGARLTKKGLKISRKLVRKHRLLERFLVDILGIRKEKVHDEACKMEHVLSDEAEEALCKILKHPEKCPDDGKPIPPCDKDVSSCVECEEIKTKKTRRKELVPLTNLTDGKQGKIAFIRGGRGAIRRLTDMGLTPHTKIKVIKSAPFHGPIQIFVRGSRLAIGRGLAVKIFVEEK